jgi:hypothetical protein
MLDSNDTTLTISTLPPRPHSLSHEEMSDVFGGCDDHGEVCYNAKDCCEGGLDCVCEDSSRNDCQCQ